VLIRNINVAGAGTEIKEMAIERDLTTTVVINAIVIAKKLT
jgi:hypothetical protein